MATDVIAHSIPEFIQYYWQRIEKFYWLPDSEEALLHHLLHISARLYNPNTPASFLNHQLPAFHNDQHSKKFSFAFGSDQHLLALHVDSTQPTLTPSISHRMKSIAYQTADLIVIHLQAVPPEHYLAKRRLHPLHRLKVPLSPPPARPGARLPEMPSLSGIRARPITNPQFTSFPT